MEPIRVPAPPKEAFNKHRRVSDLIRKQVNHFKHLEQKLPETVRTEIPQHPVVTEDDAARYVATMTHLLLARSTPTQKASPIPASARTRPKKAASHGLSLVAAAEAGRMRPPRRSKPAKKAGETSRKAKKK
jgi:hypothetical protein